MEATNVVMTHVTGAGISVALINALKNSKYFPWVTQEKTNILRALAVASSAITAAGIHYTWNPHARELIFTLPTVAGLWAFGVGWVKSFIMQEITYQVTRKPNGAGLVANKQAGIGGQK